MSNSRRLSGPSLTQEMAAHIKALWRDTNLNQAQIAARMGGINQGRVSEVINGLRYAEVPPADTGGA